MTPPTALLMPTFIARPSRRVKTTFASTVSFQIG